MKRLLIFACLTVAAHAQVRCGTAQDMVVRALERLSPGGDNSEVEDALQLVKQAVGECAGLGDAWYYRSLFEAKLGRKQLADYALQKAKLLGSDALKNGADPFRIAAPAGRPPSKTVRDKYAVVIGVGKFGSSDIPPLKLTTKDARDFAAVLTDPQYGRFPKDHVHLLTDDRATTINIKSELNWLARTAGPDDMAVIYLASHGSSRDMDTAGANYVITYDTNIADQDQLYATALPMVEVADVVRTRMQAQRAAVFLDTCHSGGAIARGVIAHAASASPAMMQRMDQGSGRVIIASSQVAEQSWESEKLGNGYFTYFLVHAMKQANGMEPIGAIYDYLKSQVSQAVAADVKAQQHPVISRSDADADKIILGAPPGSAASAALLRRFSLPVPVPAF
ncbi:MAG TPA: caspase family protein [Bryobacteraceae bacterium]|jgi:hypothetical protein